MLWALLPHRTRRPPLLHLDRGDYWFVYECVACEGGPGPAGCRLPWVEWPRFLTAPGKAFDAEVLRFVRRDRAAAVGAMIDWTAWDGRGRHLIAPVCFGLTQALIYAVDRGGGRSVVASPVPLRGFGRLAHRPRIAGPPAEEGQPEGQRAGRAVPHPDLHRDPQPDAGGGPAQYYQDYSGRIYGSNDPP